MSNRIHALAQQLTGKATIDECSLEEVKHIAKRFPYFAPAQFLLLQKLRQSNSPEADNQYKKAVLFFHDPLLFDYFISSDKFYVDEARLFSGTEAKVAPYETEGYQVTADENSVDEPAELKTSEIHFRESEEVSESTMDQIGNEVEIQVADEQPGEAEAIIVPPPMIEKEWADYEEPSPEMELQEKTENTQSILPNDIIAEQIEKELKASEAAGTELKIEPYHTVDYFASQGIKISQEELPKDKLGKQLKSFTEWLKTMKRLPSAQISEATETLAEKKVESMADSSVSESEVVTETMAEVWAKQGNREKAMETYNKLSLLDPSKRAYFAAKIENLKQL